jgi:hypothetical protein
MNKRSIARYEADDRVRDFMTAHDVYLTAISLYTTEKTAFLTGMNKLETAMQKQTADTKKYAVKKDAIMEEMAASLYKFSLRGSVQADQLGMIDLAFDLDKSLTYFSVGEDNLIISRANEQKDLMKNSLSVLTEISPADILDMETKIAAYTAVRDQPEKEIRLKKITSSDIIPDLLNDIDIIKYRIGMLVYSYLPGLADEWDEISKVGMPEGTRHTDLAVHFSSDETGINLPNVKCTVSSAVDTITKKSSKKGWVRYFNLEPRDWDVTSELEGYETDVQPNVGIDGINVVKLGVRLRRKTMPGDQETTTGALSLFASDKETGQALDGAQYILHEAKRRNTTDEDGEGYEDLLAPGPQTGTLYMEGYHSLPFNFTVEAGKILTLELLMERI